MRSDDLTLDEIFNLCRKSLWKAALETLLPFSNQELSDSDPTVAITSEERAELRSLISEYEDPIWDLVMRTALCLP